MVVLRDTTHSFPHSSPNASRARPQQKPDGCIHRAGQVRYWRIYRKDQIHLPYNCRRLAPIVKSLHKRNTFSIQHYSSDYTDSCFAILSHRQFTYTVKNSIVVSSLPKAVYTACAITIRLTQR